jgi:sugar-specific transcriptional regulator TrmB
MANPSAALEFDSSAQKLVDIGLTLNEARCYLALLHIAPATAAEIANASGVPRAKVYATLKSLEQRGFCFPSGDRVTRFRAVDPELALAELTRAREHERRLAGERDRHLRSELAEALPATPDHMPEDSDEIMQHTGGKDPTIKVYEGLISRTEGRVDIVHGIPMLQDPDRWNRAEVEALARGAQVRVLFPSSELAAEHRYEEVVEAGGEVRIARGSPLKLVVRDGAEALVALRNPADELHPTCVAIRHADLVAPLQLMFSREWRRAGRLLTPRRQDGAVLPSR